MLILLSLIEILINLSIEKIYKFFSSSLFSIFSGNIFLEFFFFQINKSYNEDNHILDYNEVKIC